MITNKTRLYSKSRCKALPAHSVYYRLGRLAYTHGSEPSEAQHRGGAIGLLPNCDISATELDDR